MIWSEMPPTESGWYWVRNKRTGTDGVRGRRENGDWPNSATSWSTDAIMSEYFLFGPPIPSPEQCHEIAKGGGA